MPVQRSTRGRAGWLRYAVAAAFLIVGAVFLHRTFLQTGDGGKLSFVSVAVAVTWFVGGLVLLWLARSHGSPGSTDKPPRSTVRRPLAVSLGVALAFAVVCVVGALVLNRIPLFEPWVGAALATASASVGLVLGVALVTGAAEEVFFRIGLRTVIADRWYVPVSTALYALVTLTTGNGALVLASVMLGVVAAQAYRWIGRWYAPILVHALWTAGVIGVFPLLA